MSTASEATTAAMTGLWREIFELGTADVDPDEGFFEAGGTSYQALSMITRIGELFDVEIELVTVLTEGSVAFLAELVDTLRSEALMTELDGLSDEEASRLLAADTTKGM
jgi:acyl carrier protein